MFFAGFAYKINLLLLKKCPVQSDKIQGQKEGFFGGFFSKKSVFDLPVYPKSGKIYRQNFPVMVKFPYLRNNFPS
jgi:hypothetical protein